MWCRVIQIPRPCLHGSHFFSFTFSPFELGCFRLRTIEHCCVFPPRFLSLPIHSSSRFFFSRLPYFFPPLFSQTLTPPFFRNIQWNLDLTKGQRTGKMCSLHRSFVIWRFFFIYRISSNDSRPWINSLLPIIASTRIAYRLAVYDICRLQTADCRL